MVGDMTGNENTPRSAHIVPPDCQNLLGYEAAASQLIAPETWQYIQSGADAEWSIAANRRQFERYSFIPQMLADMQDGTTEIELFGLRHAAPILLAPVAYHRLVHPQGEVATISAATALETTMVASTLSSIPLENIANAARSAAIELGRDAPPPLWFQLYFQADRGVTANLVARAEAAGYQVLVVTVDAAVKRSDFILPEGVEAVNLRDVPRPSQQARAGAGGIVFGTELLAAAPNWADIAWLRSLTKLPIVIKGLLSAEDARQALAHGADGVIVSNHGGRVLDGLIPPMEALPAMVEAVEDRIPLLLDSGVRFGTDVLKALNLGARAVLVGRPQLHALAIAGVQGVAHMLHLLRAELELAMVQTGCTSPDDARKHKRLVG